MRYRLQVSWVEFAATLIPFIDGTAKVFGHNHHSGGGPLSQLFHNYLLPYLLLSAPLVVILQYLCGYVELTPSSLEWSNGLRHRSIPYAQMDKVASKQGIGLVGSGTTTLEIWVSGKKKLRFKLNQTEDFLTELRQYAPLAFVEGLVPR